MLCRHTIQGTYTTSRTYILLGTTGGISDIGKTSAHLSLQDITAQISAVKEAAKERKAAAKPYKYVPPGGWKEPDADWLASLPPGKVCEPTCTPRATLAPSL